MVCWNELLRPIILALKKSRFQKVLNLLCFKIKVDNIDTIRFDTETICEVLIENWKK